jgi:hypothetical protein
MIDINVKRNSDKAHLPKFLTKGCGSLTAVRIIKNGLLDVWYDCQITVDIPEGYIGLILPNISILHMPLLQANCGGVVSPGCRTTLQIRFKRTFWGVITRKQYKVNTVIANFIIVKTADVKYIDIKNTDKPQRPRYVGKRQSRQTNVVNT